jgi:hypothetical protein
MTKQFLVSLFPPIDIRYLEIVIKPVVNIPDLVMIKY